MEGKGGDGRSVHSPQTPKKGNEGGKGGEDEKGACTCHLHEFKKELKGTCGTWEGKEP